MDRRQFIALVGAVACCPPAMAQQRAKSHRIYWVSTESQPDPFVDGFREGLRELGYLEGRDYRIELRYAPGNPGLSRMSFPRSNLRASTLSYPAAPRCSRCERSRKSRSCLPSAAT